jgi:protoheme IX farnesyltransferase
MTLLRRLSTTTAAATLALVAVGGVVRATGSGLGCPDWPRCHGRWIPPLEYHALIEYSHRLTAVVVGVLVVAAAWVAWRRARTDRGVLAPAVAAVGVVAVQAGLGRMVVVGELQVVALNMAHFITAMLLVALVVAVAAGVRVPRGSGPPPEPEFRSLLWWTLGSTALLLLAGVYVRAIGASLAFLDWPLMDGRFLPSLGDRHAAAHFVHRVLALATLGLAGGLAWRARRAPRRALRVLTWTAFGLVAVQAMVGAVAVLSRLATPAVAVHISLSSLAWAALVTAAVITGRLRAGEVAAERPRARRVAGAYVQLMKPDIIVLLLVTTVPAMVLALGSWPSWGLMAATLLGGTLVAGGANAMNCYVDRDIDEVMTRTRGRPIPALRIPPPSALRFGLAMAATGFLWLAATVNLLAATLTGAAAVFYVVVYTMWIKRLTPQNIVIGGAAGAVPALVGWAAVTGRVDAPAWVMFAIVFVWTPPHFWALSLRHARDYADAHVPMLPVVRGARDTGHQILLYSVLLVATSLLLFPAARLGALYLTAAVLLGGAFVWHAWRVVRVGGARAAMALFHYSITYLAVLFAAAAADRLVLG